MNALERYANEASSKGWSIVSLSSENLVLKRKKPPNQLLVLIGIIGLLFLLIPGLIILLIAYVSRGEETVVVTLAQAEQFEKKKAIKHAEQIQKEHARKTRYTERFPKLARWIPLKAILPIVIVGGVILLIVVLSIIASL